MPGAASTTGLVVDIGSGATPDRDRLGGKGAGLVRMAALGLPVPPGFVVTTEAGRAALAADDGLPPAVQEAVVEALAGLARRCDRRLGEGVPPFLVSVRSGAPVSMPGMMDTVLNVGLTPAAAAALAAATGRQAFAGGLLDRLTESFQSVVGADLPDDPVEQVLKAVGCVFGSWNSSRARAYRRFRGISEELGTAAVVQVMAFGNLNERSASGVAFTRDPSSGRRGTFGDILFDAQGEEVVAGEHDAQPIAVLERREPAAMRALEHVLRAVEEDARDMCEVEFTVQDSELWVLQTRVGQRSGRAAVRIAVDLVDEGRIDVREALARLAPADLEAAAVAHLARPPTPDELLADGLGVSPGCARGCVAFSAQRAVALEAQGRDVVLVRPTTSPADVEGFIAAVAVVTGRGGKTSHAAVVARGLHRPAVCGVGEIAIGADGASADIAGTRIAEGDLVTVDGEAGIVARGELSMTTPEDDPALRRVFAWRVEARGDQAASGRAQPVS